MLHNKPLNDLGYKVVNFIGKGSFGEVKLVESEKYPNQYVAIKVMHRRLAPDVFVNKLLPRELDILKRVKHPHIVHVHEIHDTPNGQVFVVMEAAVTNLHEKIYELGCIPIEKAKMWFSQLISAVVYLHEQDIVHRDLKCENVLLTADDQIKLTDFGLSRFSKGFPDLSDTFYFTPEFSAPEVLLKKPYDPKKSDIWSLGVILYYMVTGSTPFSLKSMKSLRRSQRKPLVYPNTVEEPCRALISYMMQYEPSTRPSVAELARHPWLQLKKAQAIGRFLVTAIEEQDGKMQMAEGSKLKNVSTSEDAMTSSSHQQSTEEKWQYSFSVSDLVDSVSSDSEDGLWFYSTYQSQEKDSQTSSSRELMPEPEDNSSRALGECGCFSPLCAVLKKAANTYIAAPIQRASRSLRGRAMNFFVSLARNSSSSSQQGTTAAPASSSVKQRPQDVTPDVLVCGPVVEAQTVLPQPPKKQGSSKRRLPKILRKNNKVHVMDLA